MEKNWTGTSIVPKTEQKSYFNSVRVFGQNYYHVWCIHIHHQNSPQLHFPKNIFCDNYIIWRKSAGCKILYFKGTFVVKNEPIDQNVEIIVILAMLQTVKLLQQLARTVFVLQIMFLWHIELTIYCFNLKFAWYVQSLPIVPKTYYCWSSMNMKNTLANK